METKRDRYYELIESERTVQEIRHPPATDDLWSPQDWHEMFADYNGWARRKWSQDALPKARDRYKQIAALAVAAMEAIDRQIEERAWRASDKYQERIPRNE